MIEGLSRTDHDEKDADVRTRPAVPQYRNCNDHQSPNNKGDPGGMQVTIKIVEVTDWCTECLSVSKKIV